MSDLSKIESQIQVATNYQTNKRMLREQAITDLHFPYNGGLFIASQEMIAFMYAMHSMNLLIVEDTYENPIEVVPAEFLVLLKQHYQAITNTWHQQHAILKQTRKI